VGNIYPKSAIDFWRKFQPMVLVVSAFRLTSLTFYSLADCSVKPSRPSPSGWLSPVLMALRNLLFKVELVERGKSFFFNY